MATNAEMKEELRAAGLSEDGTHPELAARLDELHAAQGVAPSDAVQDDPAPDGSNVPPVVHADLAVVESADATEGDGPTLFVPTFGGNIPYFPRTFAARFDPSNVPAVDPGPVTFDYDASSDVDSTD